MKLKDVQQEFVNKVIESLEKDIIPWHPSWNQGITKPVNAKTNQAYTGSNAINLFMESIAKEYTDPRWMTFKQASDAGYKIKKGSNEVHPVNWTTINGGAFYYVKTDKRTKN